MPHAMTRDAYAEMFGPTTGDRVRLGDTNLHLRVERDLTVYGDECKFGGGKVLREGQGQAAGVGDDIALDTVITNALIVDYTGIYKADVGIKRGRIVGIGKAGNPDIMAGVDDNLIVGVTTEAVAGEGMILTAGGFDSHIHFICPQILDEALASGLTTLLGGGTGPATGTCATTCTPGSFHLAAMLSRHRRLAPQPRAAGQGQHRPPRRTRRRAPRRGRGIQAPRGLGHHPRRHRHLPRRRRGTRCPGRHPHRHAQRVGLRRSLPRRVQGADHSYLPQRRRGRRARARYHPRLRLYQRPAKLYQPHPSLYHQHPRRAPGYVDGVSSSGQEPARGCGVCRK